MVSWSSYDNKRDKLVQNALAAGTFAYPIVPTLLPVTPAGVAAFSNPASGQGNLLGQQGGGPRECSVPQRLHSIAQI